MTSVAQVAAAIALATLSPGRTHHPEARDREIRDFARITSAEAARFDLPPLVLVALITRESDWRPDAVNPVTGARGLGQLNVFAPDGSISPVGREILSGGWEAYVDQLYDPAVNLFLSARWLRRKLDQCRQKDDPILCAIRRYGGAHTSVRAREILKLAERLERETAEKE